MIIQLESVCNVLNVFFSFFRCCSLLEDRVEESKQPKEKQKKYNLNYTIKMWVNISNVRDFVNASSSRLLLLQTIEFGIT